MMCRLDDYERVLLAEVIERPCDELALNVYSDWLLDQPDRAAQTRGEYIKIELALAKSRRLDSTKDLRWQAHDLWWNHGESWLGPLYSAVDHFIYERGRLVIEISERTFIDAGPEAVLESAGWDLVSAIVFRSCSLDLLVYLRDLPRPAVLVEFEIPGKSLAPGELEYLLEGDFWRDLSGLSLAGNAIGDSGAAALADWPGLASLLWLNLDSTLIGPEGARALARSGHLKLLRLLTLRHNRLRGSYDEEELRGASELLRSRFGRRVKFG